MPGFCLKMTVVANVKPGVCINIHYSQLFLINHLVPEKYGNMLMYLKSDRDPIQIDLISF